MDPITIALTLAKFAPSLVRWISGSDKAGAVAQKAVDIAQAVTGKSTPEAAVSALEADPNLALQYHKAVLDQETTFEQLAVQNAEDINKTMQTESGSSHWPTYSWRPYIGFAVGTNVFASSALVLIVYGPVMFGVQAAAAAIGSLPTALGALAAVNATVLPILGIASWFRGKMQADARMPTDARG